MKKNDKINLDSISNINEKIIDEVTDKKISLLQKSGGTAKNLRKKFIAIGSIAASFILMFSVLLVIIIPMLGSDIPVYQGMTIRQASTSSMEVQEYDFSANGITLLSSSSGNNGFTFLNSSNGNGNAYGHDKDNHKDKDDKPKNDIEDIVVIDVKTDDEVRYYVKPGETFIIEIHIDNPRDYEIQSFTLNGKKYANYMFKEGSTMELLLLEVTAQSEPGYVEYTIDAIKYIDGTEIKDVDMSSGDKSVKAGIAYPTTPSASVTSHSILPTSIEFSVNITDQYKLIGQNELSIYLSDGESIISSKPLSIGENNITFDNLTMNKTYEYGVVTSFDSVDGKGMHEEWLLTSTVTTAGAFGISNAVPTQDSITFEVEKIGEVGEITSVSLFDAETDDHVASGGADIREFTGLLSNHTYNLYVDFKYTANGEEIADWIAIKGIKTGAKNEPTVSFGDVTADKTSLSYSVEATDPDSILIINKVELLKGDETVKDNGTNLIGTFDTLLSNNSYTVKVSYTYDLNDGQGTITKSVTKIVNTVAKATPTITFSDISVTESTITGKYNVTDVDNVGEVSAVEVYKNGASLKSNEQKELNFAGLEYYTEHQIKVIYTYDLNDGQGTQEKTVSYSFKTSPHLAFNSCDVINTSAVNEGETIFMQINITNPNKVVYTKIVVNGEEYDVVKNSSTETMLVCEIVNKGQFEGGETMLTVEKVIAALDGKTYTIEPKENNVSSVFVNGKLSVEKLNGVVFKDGQYVDTEYIFPSDTAYLKITFYNKTGYNIDSVTINGKEYSALTKLDDEHYLIEMPYYDYKSSFVITSVKYSRPNFENTLSVSHTDCYILKLDSEEIQYVSKPEDLLSMNDGFKYYELTCDIDLSGMEWHGGSFQGVLEGNGYSIKNMSYVGTILSEITFLGLFETADGVIKNLTMEGVKFIIQRESHDSGFLFFGSIAARSERHLVIDNCVVDKTSFINIDGNAVGGLVGVPNNTYIRNCTNYASIIGNNCVGGIVSGHDNSYIMTSAVIENCANYGNIIGKEHIGGIAGSVMQPTQRIIFKNCINYGSVSGESYVGGIMGYTYCPATSFLFENCANYGSIFAENGAAAGIIGGGDISVNTTSSISLEGCINFGSIAPDFENDLFENMGGFDTSISNCYALGDNVILEQLNSKSFYTDTLGLDETVWNLDDLDIENGKYPTLK